MIRSIKIFCIISFIGIGIFSAFLYLDSHALVEARLQARLTARSSIYYALNRIARSRWLNGTIDFADPNLLRSALVSYPDILEQRKSHFRLTSDLPVDSIADHRHNLSISEESSRLSALASGSRFKVWVEPLEYRNGSVFPLWNGCFRIQGMAEFQNIVATESCVIRSNVFTTDYIVFADKGISLFSNDNQSLECRGPLFSNGICVIGENVSVHHEGQESQIVGTTYLFGQLTGNLTTSAFTISPSELTISLQNHIKQQGKWTGHINLQNGYDRIARFSNSEAFYPWVWEIAHIWNASGQPSFTLFPYCGCQATSSNSISNIVDCVSPVICEEGFQGDWISVGFPADYPALAQVMKDNLPPSATSTEAHKFNESFSEPSEYSPESINPQLSRIPFPNLDFNALKSLSMQSPEFNRSNNRGTCFSDWEEFSNYLNNPAYSLVERSNDPANPVIRLGLFSPDGTPQEPIVFYIERAKNDLSIPDHGCFRIDISSNSLIINGCIVTESSLDVRDKSSDESVSGRYRDFSIGRDGRVVLFCGFPVSRAESKASCDEYPNYQWVDDGVGSLTVLGYPGAPALAAMGDIWIIDRHFATQIHGPLFSQSGDILIWNKQLADGKPAVICHSPILGSLVQLGGSIEITNNDRLSEMDFLKNLNFYQFSILHWDNDEY